VRSPEGLKGASIEIFAGLARTYERTLDLATLYQDRKWKDWVARRLGPGSGGYVLDLGCGTLILEARMARSGHRFVGLDLSPEMTKVGARKRAPNVGLLANGDAECLPFTEGTFDSVVSCYVPKYVDPWMLANEIARVVKPGGSVVLYDFARPTGPMTPFLQLYIQWGLRAVGWVFGASGRREAATFRKLPWIIEGTRWDVEVPRAMEANGIVAVQSARLTAGAVFAYWGKKARGHF
jgi:demethylmenaquinone methyltransferase / 2-methoxy-6-polyprenyl-1,4-benzoquinol methylase